MSETAKDSNYKPVRYRPSYAGRLLKNAAGVETTSVIRLVPATAKSFDGNATQDQPFHFGFMLKGLMDRAGALVALVLFSPLFAILAWKIRQDGGPALYGHTRIGKNGKSFKCWKFRSMAVNSREMLAELLARDPEARAEYEKNFKLKNDPRITKIGQLLRKTSLDEIPQIFNVLRGEMSLVGPRPIVEDERRYYGSKMRLYTAVKPGITGLWQVSGRSDTGYEKRVHLDCFYVENWSLGRDIVILFKTVYVVLARKGAY